MKHKWERGGDGTINGEILSYTISDKQDIACVLDTLNQLNNRKQATV